MNKNSRVTRWGISFVGTASFVLVWFLATEVFGLFLELVLPSPVTIVERIIQFQDLIIDNFFATFNTGIAAFVTATIVGVGVAVVFSLSERISNALMPLALSMNSVPRITIAPLLIFYFGNFQTKFFLAVWIAFFPLFLNAYEGIQILEEDQENLMDSLGATRWQEYRYMRFPNAIPHIFDGMKIGLTLSMVGAVVAEFVGAGKGLGWMALISLRSLNMPMVWAATGIIGVATVILFFILFVAQDQFVYWKETNLFGE